MERILVLEDGTWFKGEAAGSDHFRIGSLIFNTAMTGYQEIITDNIRVCREYGNAITVVPCTAAMLKTYDSLSTKEQVPRDNLKTTQTPQAFFLQDILAAHREALEKGITRSVASCTMYIELGRKLYMSQGSEKNLKLTTTEDIEIFKALLNAKKDEWIH